MLTLDPLISEKSPFLLTLLNLFSVFQRYPVMLKRELKVVFCRQVVIYKQSQATPELEEFAKVDVKSLVAGCDIILDAQLVANCIVLYVSSRATHKLQLIVVPLLSTHMEELTSKMKVIDVSTVLDLWNKFDSIVDSKLYVTPTLAMVFGDKQFQIIDFVADVIA